MSFNHNIHHRRSIRLKGYDYSQAGAYFVTICTKDRECLFGDIAGEIKVNDAGRMVQKWWNESAAKFGNIELDESVIMPNHFHGIIVIVGAALCGRPDLGDHHRLGGRPGLGGHPEMDGQWKTGQQREIGQPHRVAPTVGDIIDWFKTMTTNEYIRNVRQKNWSPFPGKLWQRNYYEHIIRNETEMNKIREYIINNPLNWETDENYKAD
jgi:putative transposase